jgi:hypothetical protein
MILKNRMLSGAALSAFAGTMLFAASAFAQAQPSEGAPGAGAMSQPSTAEPGSEAQPYGATQQGSPDAHQQMNATQPMNSPQSASSPTMTNASNGEPLSKVKNAKTILASASVQDSTGNPIGQVTSVHTTKRGTPTTIDVMLQTSSGQAKTVAIKASRLEYDQSSNTLKADLTSSEVQALPTATGM